jgi:hypothetical protein
MRNMKKFKNSRFNSIFRTEAFALLFIVLFLVAFYVCFLLEFHLKWIAEKTAFESIGSEVNISKIDIDFLNPILK